MIVGNYSVVFTCRTELGKEADGNGLDQSAISGEIACKVASAAELHDDEDGGVVPVNVDEIDDVQVIQALEQRDFAHDGIHLCTVQPRTIYPLHGYIISTVHRRKDLAKLPAAQPLAQPDARHRKQQTPQSCRLGNLLSLSWAAKKKARNEQGASARGFSGAPRGNQREFHPGPLALCAKGDVCTRVSLVAAQATRSVGSAPASGWLYNFCSLLSLAILVLRHLVDVDLGPAATFVVVPSPSVGRSSMRR